jgi:hypothetical protein
MDLGNFLLGGFALELAIVVDNYKESASDKSIMSG